MVSSVLVLLASDAGVSGTRTTDCGEEGKTISGRDVALGVGKEDMFRMEIKIRAASRHVSPIQLELKPIRWGLGTWGHPNLYKKRDIILLAFFCLATHIFVTR